MKKIIDRKLYDTDTAKEIASYSYGYYGDFSYIDETLYRKKTGEFFLYGSGGPMTKYSEQRSSNEWGSGEAIIPLDIDEAKEWLEQYGSADAYIDAFGPVEE